jgi:peptide/nickel transport system substrate-binding protein
MILDANPNYWGGRANIDQIELVFPDQVKKKDYLKSLRDGKIDFAQIYESSDWTGPLHTPEFLEKFETATLDENVIMTVAWNCQKKPFDDKRVRVALTELMDRPRVIEDVLSGSARPVSGPFYPTLWGADPSVAPWPFDPAKAQAAFDAAGLPKKPNGGARFSIELLVEDDWRGSSSYDELLAIFRADMEKAGVDLNVTYIPRDEVGERLILHNFDAVMFLWSPDVPDPDPFQLLHSTQYSTTNYAGYVNPEVDKLLEAGRRSNDRAHRKEAYYALHKLVHDDEPYSFLFAPQSHYAWNRRIHGASPLDISSLPRQPGVARWWVDKQ